MEHKPRITIPLDTTAYAALCQIAADRRWSRTSTAQWLIEQAIARIDTKFPAHLPD